MLARPCCSGVRSIANCSSLLRLFNSPRNRFSTLAGVIFSGIHGLPPRMGTLRNLSHFDSGFFEVHDKQAEVMDPQYRLMLETAYEAIVDAGLNPSDLRGSKTGVFAGVAKAESREYWNGTPERVNGYGLPGNATSMSVNRISYAFDLKGPSLTVDTACASSAVAFHEAIQSIRTGESDAAIVSGVNIILQPLHSLQFTHLKILHPEGVCRTFDARNGGYVKTEACVTLLVQKKSAAKRAYATVVTSGTNCDGYKEEGVTHPSERMQRELAERLYREIRLDARAVVFVEAHGTGTTVGDRVEGNWMAEFYCQNRDGPLLVGSVKSNTGHPEPAAGVVSLAKIIIAMETGIIPANLNYLIPNPEIQGLHDGRLQVVDKNWPWNGGYVAMNNFGLGGTNVHIVLKSNESKKIKSQVKPCLICVSGRTQAAVDNMLAKIESTPFDDEYITLIHNVFRKPIDNLNYAGFSVLGAKQPIRSSNRAVRGKEVWFVFSGMGAQWKGMGRQLMSLKPFRQSIDACSAELIKLGLNLEVILNEPNDETFNDVTNCFVSICAIQVALVDTLASLKILPDHFIGHSMGEICCAYADGLLSREQAMLVSFHRGEVLKRLASSHSGAMAAIGLSLEEAKAACAGTNVTVACHNSLDNVTISGPIDEVDDLVKEMLLKGKFARTVPSAGFALHSKYLVPCVKELEETLKQILPNIKRRSERWVSTSFPESDWSTPQASHFGAPYLTGNLINPVHFHEALGKIPAEGTVVIEVSPHALLQPILKRSTPEEVTHVGLLKRDSEEELCYFMGSVGRLYMVGLNPDLTVFHTPSQLPVSRGTPMISPLVEWDHSREWAVPSFFDDAPTSSEIVEEINVRDDDSCRYLLDHKIDGRVIFPVTGYIDIAWKALSKIYKSTQDQTPVIFENVQFLRSTLIRNEGLIQFRVKILKASGCFEIFDSETLVATGVVRRGDVIPTLQCNEVHNGNNSLALTKEDVYKILRLRGYEYGENFQLIDRIKGFHGVLSRFSGQWTSFLHAHLQLTDLCMVTNDLYVPTRIGRCFISPSRIPSGDASAAFNLGRIRSEAVEIRDVEYTAIPRRPQNYRHVLETTRFVPYIIEKEMNLYDAILIFLQIVFENLRGNSLKILNSHENTQFNSILNEISNSDPTLNLHIESSLDNTTGNYDLICGFTIQSLPKVKDGGFFLIEETPQKNGISRERGLNVVARIHCQCQVLTLLRFRSESPVAPSIHSIPSDTLQVPETQVPVIYRTTEPHPNECLVELMTQGLASCLIVDDAPLEPKDHGEQLIKGLKVNALKGSAWGSIRRFRIENRRKMVPVNLAFADALTRGDLTTLHWIQNSSPSKGGHHCIVYYSAINLLDLLLASGRTDMIPGFKPEKKYNLGLEFSGKDHKGNRVMGLVDGKALATVVIAHPSLVWNVPDTWSLQEAASVPFNYAVGCYALLIKAKLKKNDSLLIHGGWKGFGQASLRVGLGLGARVITTVESDAQRNFLLRTFPELPSDCILPTDSFDQILLNDPNEESGVDVILNLLDGPDLFFSSVRCLKEHGRMVEIGKFELSKSGSLGEQIFLKNISFHVFSLESLIEDTERAHSEKIIIHKLIQDGIHAGIVKPLPFTVFESGELETAFRHSGSGKDFKKVLIELKKGDTGDNMPATIPSIARFYPNPSKSCLIIGGLGIFGLELAHWLTARGAGRVIIARSSKKSVRRGYQYFLLKRLQRIDSDSCRVATLPTERLTANSPGESEMERLLRDEASSHRFPIGSIFNLTAVKSPWNFTKIRKTTENLDAASRKCCPELEHFICISTSHPDLTQSNFILEKICQERANDRLPGMVIKFGSIENQIEVPGTHPQSVRSCLETLESILISNDPSVAFSSKLLASRTVETPAPQQSTLENIVGKILGMKNVTGVEDTSSLEELGMDSLMGAEIFQVLENKYGLVLSKQELRSLTFSKLREISKKS